MMYRPPVAARPPRTNHELMTGAIAFALAFAVDAVAVAEYDVRCARRCAELSVEAAVPAAMGNRFVIDTGFGSYLKEAQYEDGGRWVAADARGDAVAAPRCRARACRLRYRMRLAEAARQMQDRGRAFAQDGMLVAPPSSWLLRPARAAAGGRFRLRVAPPGDARFATGLFRGRSDGEYEGALDSLEDAPYSAFGPFAVQTIRVGKQSVEVAIAPGLEARRRDLTAWVEAAARDVSGYYGKYPVPRALVLILEGRRGVTRGRTLGNGGASVTIWVAPGTTPAALAADWLLVHEMVRFGLPNLPREHRWVEEGLATYVEPLARAARGRLTASEVWMGLLEGLPRGVPGKGDRGLDDSRTWASTYWGGALFGFLADLAIRERTNNRRSLRDALRGVQAAGGTIAVRWPLERTLAAGDAATGVPVLRELHEKMGRKRGDVNLGDVWRRLGVSRKGNAVAFDDTAPLARVRRSMTEGASR
jgi:hypothetical protein